MISLLAGTWTRLAGIVAGIAGVAAVLFAVRKSGADAVKASLEKQRADTLSRMSDAESSGPHTRSDVVDRLRNGRL